MSVFGFVLVGCSSVDVRPWSVSPSPQSTSLTSLSDSLSWFGPRREKWNRGFMLISHIEEECIWSVYPQWWVLKRLRIWINSFKWNVENGFNEHYLSVIICYRAKVSKCLFQTEIISNPLYVFSLIFPEFDANCRCSEGDSLCRPPGAVWWHFAWSTNIIRHCSLLLTAHISLLTVTSKQIKLPSLLTFCRSLRYFSAVCSAWNILHLD